MTGSSSTYNYSLNISISLVGCPYLHFYHNQAPSHFVRFISILYLQSYYNQVSSHLAPLYIGSRQVYNLHRKKLIFKCLGSSKVSYHVLLSCSRSSHIQNAIAQCQPWICNRLYIIIFRSKRTSSQLRLWQQNKV